MPGTQEELIKHAATLGKPVIVLLQAGSAITMDAWIEDVDRAALTNINTPDDLR